MTVAAIVVKQEKNRSGKTIKKYLMVKEWQEKPTKQLVVNQPAGHVENHETLEDAIIRETHEETGWQVNPTHLLGLYSFTPTKDSATYHRICFICEPIKKNQHTLDPDIESCTWLTREEILSLPLRSPLVEQCIEDYENGLISPLNLLNNVHLTAYDN
ncbi:NUDIX domain-containing protein [Marinomonas algicola]|uniref:NUDIX domain-containing protein n=1 Tax=Marinomonas algicola TaxID=2773454 RepID=UPI0030843B81